MREFKSAATPEVLEYLARHARQDEVLARVERETADMPRAGMQVSVDQGALLTLLTKLVGARRYLEAAGLADRVEIVVGPAQETLEALPDEPVYDLVFIDADKSGYPGYYERALKRLKTGGLMLLDNTLLSGRVLDPDDELGRILDELNDRIARDERVDAVIAFVSDGLTFVRKR